MAYHESLWLATAAAAPVIALASVVSFNDSLRALTTRFNYSYKTSSALESQLRWRQTAAVWLWFLATVNLAIQATMLLTALGSLARNRDILAATDPAIVEPASLLLLIFSGCLTVLVRRLSVLIGAFIEKSRGQSDAPEPNVRAEPDRADRGS
jgi:hypothetical protein